MIRVVLFSILIVIAFAKPSPLAEKPQLDGRIVGGEEVDIKDFPYQVALLRYGAQVCGGSIISELYIITAAHCTAGDVPSILTICAGSSKPHSGGIVFQVAKFYVNPKNDPATVDYDITILELAAPLTFGPGIGNIGLPTVNQLIPAGVDAVTSGWGFTTEGGTSSDILHAVTVQMVSNEDCNIAFGGLITDRMICAGNMPQGGKDVCQGDSGGPLVVNAQLVGIVSWGFGCARPDYPGVYGSVPNMREFITEITEI